jgi:hypothetical protein
MAHERLSPREPTKALKAYASALPLLKIAETEIAAFLPPNSGPPHASGPCKLDFSSFTRFRELWRWVERLTWRAVILAARSSSLHAQEGPDDSVWTWLAHYSSCSAYWPATFRTRHRSTISVLHLRAFIIRAGSLPTHDPWKPALWLHGARTVIHEYRAILNVSTQFPRAGDRNVKVEEFVDLCVAVWEASGAVGDYAGWVIDVREMHTQ